MLRTHCRYEGKQPRDPITTAASIMLRGAARSRQARSAASYYVMEASDPLQA
jgi:hypothetical protein